MVKLFLAEDEITMREGIRRLMHWEEEGILFCGEAGDGELAWPQILETRPDIVLTDIKMPFMDGLELTRLIRKELPDTKVVILSGYSEFEYAQEALHMGVTEYLLKPITPKRLREVIRNLAETIEEERRSKEERFDLLKEEVREREEHDRRKLLKILITGKSGTSEILRIADGMGIRLSALAYRVLLVFLSCESDYRKEEEGQELLGKMAEEREDCLLFTCGLDSHLLLLKGRNSEELEAESGKLVERIISLMTSVPDLHYFVCVGRDAARLSAVHKVYREAYRASARRFLLPADQVIRVGEPLSAAPGGQGGSLISTDAAAQNGKVRAALETFMRTGTLSEAGSFMEDAFSSLGEGSVKSLLFLNYLTMDCYFCMMRFLKDLGREDGEFPGALSDINAVIAAQTCEEDAVKYLTACLEEVIRLRDRGTSRKNSQLLQSALEYIDAHYTEGDLSLQSVAAESGLSPNRFSALFSHEMGMTFIEYLIGKRMERAAHLLMTTDMKSFEVAYNSGYNDPHYFSTTFKKLKGMSPMEYRKRRQAGEESEADGDGKE